MKILKGERWLVATRGAGALEVQLLEDALTHEDSFVNALILKGERTYINKADEGPGDTTALRTSLTTWRKQLAAA